MILKLLADEAQRVAQKLCGPDEIEGDYALHNTRLRRSVVARKPSDQVSASFFGLAAFDPGFVLGCSEGGGAPRA